MREEMKTTLGEVLRSFRELRDAPLDDATLTEWISELDAMALDEVVSVGSDVSLKRYDSVGDRDTELSIPFPDTFVYFCYLSMRCDLVCGDYSRYNLSAQAFESAWRSFADRYQRTHSPKRAAFRAGGALERY